MIGNPLTIGANSLTWEGRQLKQWNNGIYVTVDYGYNADGIRTYKEVYDEDTGETTRYEYTLNGSQIIKETVYVNNVESHTLVYIYDETGSPIGYRFRVPSYAEDEFDGYFFEKNLQGDIIAVYNQYGTKLVTYTYDACGSCTTTYVNAGSATAARYNPFRYRGYYLDSETNWYYLQSRYYNPTWGRFVNEDAYLGTGGFAGYNIFTYCINNPVMFVDPTGYAVYVDLDADGDNDLVPANDVDSMGGGTYHYGVDLSFAARSSFFSGGLYGNGYTSYYYYSAPSKHGSTGGTFSSPTKGITYYHVTTMESAKSIASSNTMKGSSWEGG